MRPEVALGRQQVGAQSVVGHSRFNDDACCRTARKSTGQLTTEKPHVKSRILLVVLLAIAAGCGDGTGLGGLSGSLSFSHSGATTGTFSASGSVLTQDPEAGTWAAGARDDANQMIAIAANIGRPSNTFDDIVIDFPQLTPGSVTMANGAHVVITFGQTQSGTATWFCDLTSGSVVVTSLSDGRARGTFSGTGSCLPATGGPVAFTVTNGSFDVPVITL
jgi:hypothetical protein